MHSKSEAESFTEEEYNNHKKELFGEAADQLS